MSKHTPAPWSVIGSTVYGNGLRSVLPLTDADAALMAAAPDLLAALQAIVIRVQAGSSYHCGTDVIALAQAAIARAEGRS